MACVGRLEFEKFLTLNKEVKYGLLNSVEVSAQRVGEKHNMEHNIPKEQ
jgi:hypothetical protein